MGWDGWGIRNNQSIEDAIRERCVGAEIIRMEVRSDAAYVAYRGEDGIARARVCLYEKGGERLYVKQIDEEYHPYYYDCPISIIEKLDPTDQEGAKLWRERCLLRSEGKDPLNEARDASQERLLTITLESPYYDVQRAAMVRLTDQYLAQIVIKHEDVFVRREAVSRITDTSILESLATNCPHEGTKEDIQRHLRTISPGWGTIRCPSIDPSPARTR